MALIHEPVIFLFHFMLFLVMLKLLHSLQVPLGVVQKHLHDRETVTTLNQNKSLSFVLSWISIGLQPKQTIY